MESDYRRFVRHAVTVEESLELQIVDDLAQRLLGHLRAMRSQIDRVHVFRAQSSVVQSIVAGLLQDELGFTQERVIPPEVGFITRARPDFYFGLSKSRGILAEVERGGTTTNNHDLKDLRKTHIAADAQHLFLVVPQANWNEGGLPRERPFARVARRLSAFFGDSRREVDVLSLHLFGYGSDSLTPLAG